MKELSCGIVGLPNVGKSTLFNALTKKQVAAENYPFCTIDPNLGIVNLIDPRLEQLALLHKSKKIVYATVTFVDIAGLVKGASKGEGLGNQFLANIRETDAIIQVVRCFEDEKVIHIMQEIDPIQDIEVINLELILADLQMAENITFRLAKQMKGKKELEAEHALFTKILSHLNQNLSLRKFSFTEEEAKIAKKYPFLTLKKILYVTNVSENDLPSMENPLTRRVQEYANVEGNKIIPLSAKLEEEIAQLHEADAKEFLHSIGLEETGLNRLIKAAFELLGLVTFITAGEMETRAWTIQKGMTASQAAGCIHSDIEKGFIRAEVISYSDMITYKGRVQAREAGKARSEGKEYIVQDGDVILFYHA